MKTENQITVPGAITAAPLILLRTEGAFVFILSILLYAHTGASWWRFAALLLVPDVLMAGYWLGPRWGAILYNCAHTYIGPVLLAAFAIVSSHHALLPYSLIWTAHIAMDRALGYGLKYPTGFKKTHLGWQGA
jgi:hypothetical protein